MTDEQRAIDVAVLDDLERSIGDDRTFLRELVETFLEDAPRQIEALRAGIAAGDVESTNRAAVTLKSTSASLGAMTLSAIARELQTLTALETTESSDLADPEITALVATVVLEFDRARVELESLVPPASG